MDTNHFDRLVRPFATGSRRDPLRALLGAALVGIAGLGAGETVARKRRKRKKRKKQRHGEACPVGQERLSNGTCAIACANDSDCGGCELAACSAPNTEGEQLCTVKAEPGELVTCTSTADCPLGFHCQDLAGTICIQLCAPV